jgi:hypothetical protein
MFTASCPSALDRLDVFIGRWLTEGETVATAEAPSVRILASDVYEWAGWAIHYAPCVRPYRSSRHPKQLPPQ